jgi:hypothetical protein
VTAVFGAAKLHFEIVTLVAARLLCAWRGSCLAGRHSDPAAGYPATEREHAHRLLEKAERDA